MVAHSYPAGASPLRQSLDRPSTNRACILFDSAYRMVRPRGDLGGASRHGKDGLGAVMVIFILLG